MKEQQSVQLGLLVGHGPWEKAQMGRVPWPWALVESGPVGCMGSQVARGLWREAREAMHHDRRKEAVDHRGSGKQRLDRLSRARS